MRTKTRSASANGAGLARGGAATQTVDTVPCAQAKTPEKASSAEVSRREPSLFEKAWLLERTSAYERPEEDPEAAVRVTREAVRLGYPHPLSGAFAWPPASHLTTSK